MDNVIFDLLYNDIIEQIKNKTGSCFELEELLLEWLNFKEYIKN